MSRINLTSINLVSVSDWSVAEVRIRANKRAIRSLREQNVKPAREKYEAEYEKLLNQGVDSDRIMQETESLREAVRLAEASLIPMQDENRSLRKLQRPLERILKISELYDAYVSYMKDGISLPLNSALESFLRLIGAQKLTESTIRKFRDIIVPRISGKVVDYKAEYAATKVKTEQTFITLFLNAFVEYCYESGTFEEGDKPGSLVLKQF